MQRDLHTPFCDNTAISRNRSPREHRQPLTAACVILNTRTKGEAITSCGGRHLQNGSPSRSTAHACGRTQTKHSSSQTSCAHTVTRLRAPLPIVYPRNARSFPDTAHAACTTPSMVSGPDFERACVKFRCHVGTQSLPSILHGCLCGLAPHVCARALSF